MNERSLRAALIAVAMLLAGCSAKAAAGSGDIGLVDVPRITSNWPKFLNYQNQLNADMTTLQQSRASASQKQRQLSQLQSRFAQNQSELTNDVRDAAQKIAADKHLRYVLTQQYVGYGGVDITPDVEKALNITERPTPAP